jgi:hypothetical protein
MATLLGRVASLALVVLGAASGDAAAQARVDPAQVTVAASFGQARPIASVPFTFYVWMPRSAFAWSIGAQFRASRHLLIDGTVSGWQSSQSEPYFDAIFDRRASSRTAVASAIATTAFGRIRISSGAGFGFAAVTTSSFERPSRCTPTAGACVSVSYGGTLVVSGPAVQGVLAMDVAIAPRVAAFISYRLVLPFTPGLADVSFSGGVRVAIK